MGMPLENAYLFHGHTGRDFAETYYWKSHQQVLEKAGLELVYPTAGVSEIINHKMVENKIQQFGRELFAFRETRERLWKMLEVL